MKSDAKKRPEGYDALPKRFKDYISGLEGQIDSLAKALPTAQKTRVRIIDRLASHRGEPEHYLQDGTEVAFRVGDRDEHWISVKADRQDPSRLEISGEWGGLAVLPHASNVILVRLARQKE